MMKDECKVLRLKFVGIDDFSCPIYRDQFERVCVAQSLDTQRRYLIEVKAGKGTATTAQKALEQGKADRLLYLKGDAKGGRA